MDRVGLRLLTGQLRQCLADEDAAREAGAVLNYLYADVLSLFFYLTLQKEWWRELLAGYTGGIRITQGFVLAGAVLMETAIGMVLLSRVLRYRANRWANIIAGVLHTAAVSWSLSGETPSLFYAFFATIEIATTLFTIWYAWTWPSPKVACFSSRIAQTAATPMWSCQPDDAAG